MNEPMKGMKRTHKVAEISEKNIGEEVTIMGWINIKRVFLGQVFLIVRDISGIAQVVFDADKTDEAMFEKTNHVKSEYVVAVRGIVTARTEKNYNPDMKTGKVEIVPSEFRILSDADPLPFTIADKGVNEELRMKYRYLDLRKKDLQRNFILRHQIAQSTREFLSNEGFLEVETPFLMKSTPEGARDYLVPSRIYPGNFYALPQSPQMFKQILMVAGFDRYFQIVKCFRDEDLRSDRQPEFTQIDIELSFVDVDDVIETNERLVQKIFKDTLDIDVKPPFRRMVYAEAMERFGSDKPDLRYEMELTDISSVVKGSEFGVFEDPINQGGSVRAINAKGCNKYSRKQLDSLTTMTRLYGAKGLAWIGLNEDGSYKTTLSKFFSDDKLKEIADKMNAEIGDIILICADKNTVVFNSLGALRIEIAKREELADPNEFNFVWITEFPLLEWDEDDNRYYAVHHLFTSPMDEDFHLLDTDPKSVRSKAYDLALNGYELGGGSIRISQREVQEKIIGILGISEEEMNERFGFLLDAFKFGTPPHGGLAFGLDRMAMLVTGTNDIRDVIAFPKTKDATCLMSDAPNVADQAQIDELKINFTETINRNAKDEK